MVVKFHTTIEGKIKTTVMVRGFDKNFEIELYRDKPVDIVHANWYVKSQIVGTAIVLGVTHHLPQGDLYIANEKYAYIVDKTIKYLKDNLYKKIK